MCVCVCVWKGFRCVCVIRVCVCVCVPSVRLCLHGLGKIQNEEKQGESVVRDLSRCEPMRALRRQPGPTADGAAVSDAPEIARAIRTAGSGIYEV